MITEPITTLTDYAIAALALWFTLKLLRRSYHTQQKSIGFWSIAFLGVAIAAIAGGTFHGFKPYLSATAQTMLWQTITFSLSATGGLMLVGTVLSTIAPRLQKWGFLAIGVKLLVFLKWTLQNTTFDPNFGYRYFGYVVADYLFALLIVFLLQIHAAFIDQLQSAFWIMGGILLSCAAASILLQPIAIAGILTANDIYHLLQMPALYLLYRGVRSVKDYDLPLIPDP